MFISVLAGFMQANMAESSNPVVVGVAGRTPMAYGRPLQEGPATRPFHSDNRHRGASSGNVSNRDDIIVGVNHQSGDDRADGTKTKNPDGDLSWPDWFSFVPDLI